MDRQPTGLDQPSACSRDMGGAIVMHEHAPFAFEPGARVLHNPALGQDHETPGLGKQRPLRAAPFAEGTGASHHFDSSVGNCPACMLGGRLARPRRSGARSPASDRRSLRSKFLALVGPSVGERIHAVERVVGHGCRCGDARGRVGRHRVAVPRCRETRDCSAAPDVRAHAQRIADEQSLAWCRPNNSGAIFLGSMMVSGGWRRRRRGRRHAVRTRRGCRPRPSHAAC